MAARPGLAEHVLALVGKSHPWRTAILGGACAGVVLGAAWWCGFRERLRRMTQTRRVRVEGLFVYPIKSCRGHSLQRAEMTSWGLKDDRMYMIVDAEGKFYTQRQSPRIAMIHPDMPTSEGITLRVFASDPESAGSGNVAKALFVPRVASTTRDSGDALKRHLTTCWDDEIPSIDQGDAAAAWLQKFVDKEGLRLVRVDEDSAHRTLDTRYCVGETGFADGFPILVTSQASVDDLNQRTPNVDVAINRFRTNVHVSGCGAWEEDEIRSLTVRDGAVRLDLVKPCARCIMPCNDPDAGVWTSRGEPKRTLERIRLGKDIKRTARLHKAFFEKNGDEACFGQNAIVDFSPGAFLEVGDIAEVAH